MGRAERNPVLKKLQIELVASGVDAGDAEPGAIAAKSLKGGDPDVAQRAVQLNWRNAAERLSKVIDMVGERGQW